MRQNLETRGAAKARAVSKRARLIAFAAFEAMCADQEHLVKAGYDIDCLGKLFAGCPNIRDVTVAYANIRTGCNFPPRICCTRKLNASHMAFTRVLASPGRCRGWANTVARQVLNIADAAASSGVKLDSLTLPGATYQLWDPGLRSEEELESLKAVVLPLRRLLLDIQIESNFEARNDEGFRRTWADDMADAVIKTGSLTKMLAEAANLRVLKLHLWERPYDCPSPYLEDALEDIHFSHLYDLAIGGCMTKTQYLIDVLLRHKATLRRLSISDIHLVDPGRNWPSFFDAIAGKLPNLRKVKLRGRLTSFTRPGRDFQFQTPGAGSIGVSDIEDFVLKDGTSFWDQDYDRNHWFLRRVEGYVPCGLPEDNTEPDGPILEYEQDGIDASF